VDDDVDNDVDDTNDNTNKKDKKDDKNNITPTPPVKVETKKQTEKPIDNMESAEIISLKKELTEHFTINGKSISREIDISNAIVFKDNIYTVAIQ
jgi:hypothetical protein